MEKTAPVLAAFSLAILMAMPLVHSNSWDPQEVDEWMSKIQHAKQKVTRLQSYMQDNGSGPNPTAVTVARASITDKSPTMFGRVDMTDDPSTEGPKPTSKQVGRARGLFGSSSWSEMSLAMVINFVFTTGKFANSTLSILGRYSVLHLVRELSIFGGSGAFRLARGIVKTGWYSANYTTANVISEYNVAVIHY